MGDYHNPIWDIVKWVGIGCLLLGGAIVWFIGRWKRGKKDDENECD
jgi:hypothetical protein